MASGILRLAELAARQRLRSLQRELRRPWREGGDGAAAEAGRWIGVGLAVGAFAAGVAAAAWVERRRSR